MDNLLQAKKKGTNQSFAKVLIQSTYYTKEALDQSFNSLFSNQPCGANAIYASEYGSCYIMDKITFTYNKHVGTRFQGEKRKMRAASLVV